MRPIAATGLLAWVTYESYLHQVLGGGKAPSVHALCPFGALESLYTLLFLGTYVQKIYSGTVVLLVLFALGWREAIVVGSAVVLTLALTLTLMSVSNTALLYAVENLRLPPFAAKLWATLRFALVDLRRLCGEHRQLLLAVRLHRNGDGPAGVDEYERHGADCGRGAERNPDLHAQGGEGRFPR